MTVFLSTLMDLSVDGGYVGNISMMCELAAEAGIDLRLYGFSSTGATRLQGDVRVLKMSGAGALIVTALYTLVQALIVRPECVILTQAGSPVTAFITIALKIAGIRQVYFVADVPIQAMRQHFGTRSLLINALVLWLRVSERIVDRFVDVTLTVSPGVDDLLRGRGWKGRLLRFYNAHNAEYVGRPGVGPQLRDDPALRDATLLVYQGGLQRGFRGIEQHLETTAALRDKGCHIAYIAIGYGDGEFISELAREYGIENYVRILGPRHPQLLADLLIQTDVAAAYDLWYGLTSKVFEYLANGVHVFAVQSARDVHDVCNGYVESFDDSIPALCEKLARFMENERAPRVDARPLLTELRETNRRSFLAAVRPAN